MTNELEKQFFDTFEIEAIKYCKRCCWCKIEETTFGDYDRCLKPENGNCLCVYPKITDRILLELICIVLNVFETFEVNRIMNVDSLKEKILKLSMLAKDDVYSQVRTLFEEG